MRVGELVEDVGRDFGAEFLAVAAHEAIAQADQVVADVDGRADAVDAVQRFLAVAERVVVLDVVVNQAGLVEGLDGEGGALHGVGQFPAGIRRAWPVLP